MLRWWYHAPPPPSAPPPAPVRPQPLTYHPHLSPARHTRRCWPCVSKRSNVSQPPSHRPHIHPAGHDMKSCRWSGRAVSGRVSAQQREYITDRHCTADVSSFTPQRLRVEPHLRPRSTWRGERRAGAVSLQRPMTEAGNTGLQSMLPAYTRLKGGSSEPYQIQRGRSHNGQPHTSSHVSCVTPWFYSD